MPLTESGLWVPYNVPNKKTRWWKGFTLPVIVSILSLLVAAGSMWITRYNTQVAQRAYLGYAFLLDDDNKPFTQLDPTYPDVDIMWTMKVQNLGNTPARRVKLDFGASSGYHLVLRGSIVTPLDTEIRPKESITFSGVVMFIRKPFHVTEPVLPMVSGAAYYDDVFGESHIDNVCYGIFDNHKSKLTVAACGNDERQTPKSLLDYLRLNR
jgi:hypothetical protein